MSAVTNQALSAQRLGRGIGCSSCLHGHHEVIREREQNARRLFQTTASRPWAGAQAALWLSRPGNKSLTTLSHLSYIARGSHPNLVLPQPSTQQHPFGIHCPSSVKGGKQDAGVPLFPTAPAARDWHGKDGNRKEGGREGLGREEGRGGMMGCLSVWYGVLAWD